MPDSWDFTGRTAAPKRVLPLLTWLTTALCILFSLAYWYSPPSTPPFWRALGGLGAQSATSIWSGRYYALLTAVFVHGGWIHLLFDMMWLVALGTALEETLRPLAWLAFFAGASVAGAGAELALSGQTGIGASGVVYGMFGLMWAGRRQVPRWRTIATQSNLNVLLVWGAFCVVATWLRLMPIANAAHAGGFLFGLSVGWLFFAKRRTPVAVASLIGLAALAALAVKWMPWSGDWTEWKGDQAMERSRPAEASTWYRRSLARGQDPDRVLLEIAEAEKQKGDYVAASAAIDQWNALQFKRQAEQRNASVRPRPTAPDQLDGQ